jgi:hypothetical protein
MVGKKGRLGVNWIIKKLERPKPIPDIAPNFPSLDPMVLRLDLLEIKNKLKKNLPPMPKRKKLPTPKKPTPQKPEESSISDRAKKEGIISDRAKKEGAISDRAKKEGIPKNTEENKEEKGNDSEEVDKKKKKEEKGKEPDDPPASLPEDKSTSFENKPKEEKEDEEKEPVVEDSEEDSLTPEEREMREREEYVWRFRILKKKYPKAEIPDYTLHSDLGMMKIDYGRKVKELYLEDCMNGYRQYLILIIVGLEFVCTKVIGIDVSDFAKEQRESMSEYDRFLIEMGEKSYSSWGQSIPVEIRLLGFIIFKLLVFFVMRGLQTGNLFGMGGASVQPPLASQPAKMRGPSIRIEDIKNMSGGTPRVSERDPHREKRIDEPQGKTRRDENRREEESEDRDKHRKRVN